MTDESSQEDAAIEKLSAVVLGGLAAPLLIGMHGLVLTQLWTWFLTPLGLPTISVAQAVGIAALVTVLVPRDSSASAAPKNASELLKYLSPKAVKLLVLLLLGAAAYAFVS